MSVHHRSTEKRIFASLRRAPVLYALLCSGTAVTIVSIAFSTIFGTRSAIASQPAVTIKMVDVPPIFEPATVTIRVGDTVEWRNVGTEVHHATTDPSMAIKSTEVGSPAGAQPFDSGFLKPGETFTHTFRVAGVYRYACAVHEARGMIGKVVVK